MRIFTFAFITTVWVSQVDPQIKFIWGKDELIMSTPKADLSCQLRYNTTSNHVYCTQIQLKKLKTFLPDPRYLLLYKEVQQNNITFEILEKNETNMQISWYSGNHEGSVDLFHPSG